MSTSAQRNALLGRIRELLHGLLAPGLTTLQDSAIDAIADLVDPSFAEDIRAADSGSVTLHIDHDGERWTVLHHGAGWQGSHTSADLPTALTLAFQNSARARSALSRPR